jgi:hypothetical protein
MKRYGYSYMISSLNSPKLLKIAQATCEEHGMLCDPNAIFVYLNAFEERETAKQLKLF